MKKLYTLSNLFEQEESSQTKIKVLSSKSSPTEQVQVQWNYQYSWPESNQLLGDIGEFVKALTASTSGDGKTILDTIKATDAKTSAIGIFREAGNTQNKRVFAKDLAQTTGIIYLFKPDVIDQALVPANKQLTKIADHFTFEVGSDTSAYYKKAETKSTTTEPVQAKSITAKIFLMPDGKAYDWYYSSTGVWNTYLDPILKKLGNATQPIEQTGKVSEAFFSFMYALPPADFPLAQTTDKTKYSKELYGVVNKVFQMAGKYDPNYSTINPLELSARIFQQLVEAFTIICINTKNIVQSNFENGFIPDMLKKPLESALKFSSATTASSNSSTNTGSQSNTNTSNGTFDGTSVNNETELAKIISGLYIKKNTAKSAVDSIDKVKALYDKDLGSGKFAASVASLPWIKGTTSGSNNASFDTIQYQALNTSKPMPYGPATATKFKELYDAAGF